jgi:hypothetical protein
MLNAATLVVGMVTFAVIAISAYFTFRTMKRGGCGSCDGCKENAGGPTCGQCKKDK